MKGSPLGVVVPEQPGEYELRYVTGKSGLTLARAKLSVGGASASLSGPASVAAGSSFKVTWKGPAGEFDRITIAAKGAADRTSLVSDFTSKGTPLGLRVPVPVGSYELRYQTGQSGAILARAALEVTPAAQEPGTLRVMRAAKPGANAGANARDSVQVVLDASGSMLERIGSERRIDIAKRTLTTLVSETIPAGTPFALRVLGRGADTCQSELDIPFGPLDRATAVAKLAALEPKSNAKTPIGATLEKVGSDSSASQGERLVILVTDGAETCGGNPARSIQKLVKSGVSLRINIVGFAVDDEKLAATFQLWADTGGGSYFDARDAKGLGEAFALAVRPAFEIIDSHGNVIQKGLVGGEPVRLLPGTYSVKLKGAKAPAQSVSVRARETTNVTF
jgi:hypothetical protein